MTKQQLHPALIGCKIMNAKDLVKLLDEAVAEEQNAEQRNEFAHMRVMFQDFCAKLQDVLDEFDIPCVFLKPTVKDSSGTCEFLFDKQQYANKLEEKALQLSMKGITNPFLHTEIGERLFYLMQRMVFHNQGKSWFALFNNEYKAG